LSSFLRQSLRLKGMRVSVRLCIGGDTFSLLLLRGDMLAPYFCAMLLLEILNVTRVPARWADSAGIVESSVAEAKAHQSSLATPRSLQHLMSAFDLHPSVAVGTPDGSKYSCSPLAMETSLPKQTRPYSLDTILLPTFVSPLGASPHPPGPNALFSILRYLISGR
jgi:hypothetical protein